MARERVDGAFTTSLHVQRAVDGNSESLGWLVARLSPLLVAQVSYHLGPQLRRLYEPEDLVNEAWLVLLPKLGTLRPRDGRLTPVVLRFLTTTLLHKLNNLLRAQARTEPVEAPGTDWGEEARADPRSGVVTQAVRAELRGTVSSCIEQLDERDREIIVLRGIEQQDTQTVAVVLGLTPKAVSVRYLRALRRLRQQLPGSVFEELDE